MRTPALAVSALLLLGPLSACGDDAQSGSGSGSGSVSGSVSEPDLATASPRASPSPSASPSEAPSPRAEAAVPIPSAEPPAPAAPPAAAPVVDPVVDPASVRMIGDGVGLPSRVVVFGDTYDEARPALDAAFGAASTDTGPVPANSDYGVCPGKDVRVVEYAGGAIRLYFGTLQGPAMIFHTWELTDDGDVARAPRASALVGDVTTVAFRPGSTVSQMEKDVGASFRTIEGDPPVQPSFRVADQSSGFFGLLSSTSSSGVVQLVRAGRGCGE